MDSKVSRRVTRRRYLRASTWISGVFGLMLGAGVLIQACSDNNGRPDPTFPASQTGRTALALFPTATSIAGTSDAGSCKEQIKFLATGGEPPYRFTTTFSAGAVNGRSEIDSSGLYKADVSAGFTFTDTVLVIDAIGARATATVTINCDVAAAPGP
jgi:hypothetical protein